MLNNWTKTNRSQGYFGHPKVISTISAYTYFTHDSFMIPICRLQPCFFYISILWMRKFCIKFLFAKYTLNLILIYNYQTRQIRHSFQSTFYDWNEFFSILAALLLILSWFSYHCSMGGIPLPGKGIVGKSRSAQSKTTVYFLQPSRLLPIQQLFVFLECCDKMLKSNFF